jgi:hypothetical protein
MSINPNDAAAHYTSLVPEVYAMLTALGVNPAKGYFQHEPPCVRWFVRQRVRAVADAKLVASMSNSQRGEASIIAAGWSLRVPSHACVGRVDGIVGKVKVSSEDEAWAYASRIAAASGAEYLFCQHGRGLTLFLAIGTPRVAEPPKPPTPREIAGTLVDAVAWCAKKQSLAEAQKMLVDLHLPAGLDTSTEVWLRAEFDALARSDEGEFWQRVQALHVALASLGR